MVSLALAATTLSSATANWGNRTAAHLQPPPIALNCEIIGRENCRAADLKYNRKLTRTPHRDRISHGRCP
jgi:hypothetical protein